MPDHTTPCSAPASCSPTLPTTRDKAMICPLCKSRTEETGECPVCGWTPEETGQDLNQIEGGVMTNNLIDNTFMGEKSMSSSERWAEPPIEIATALAAVRKGIRQLGFDAHNPHSRYNYVSTDRFLADVGPLLAEEELVIIQDELSSEISERTVPTRQGPSVGLWLTEVYHFFAVHSSGKVYLLGKRTVSVRFDGAQAYGSAQSYALKQFLRSLFMIPTGEQDDVDSQPRIDAGGGGAVPERPVVKKHEANKSAPEPAPEPAGPEPEDDGLAEDVAFDEVFDYAGQGRPAFVDYMIKMARRAVREEDLLVLQEANLESLRLITKISKADAQKIRSEIDRRLTQLGEINR